MALQTQPMEILPSIHGVQSFRLDSPYLPAWSQAKEQDFRIGLNLIGLDISSVANRIGITIQSLVGFIRQVLTVNRFGEERQPPGVVGLYGVYPYVYSTNLRKWIFVDVYKSSHDILVYFDYESEQWTQNHNSK